MIEQNWFKIWPKQFLKDEKLKGSENVRRRGAFASVLSVAKVCKCGGRFISAMDESMSAEEVVTFAGITKDDLDDLVKQDLVSCNDGLHFIKNWPKYQSDYDRQKAYRKKKTVTPSDKSVTFDTHRDGDRDGDKKGDVKAPLHQKPFQNFQTYTPPPQKPKKTYTDQEIVKVPDDQLDNLQKARKWRLQKNSGEPGKTVV